MKLNILANGNVRDAAGVSLRKIRDGANLIAAQLAVGNAHAKHEKRNCFTFAILAASDAGAIALAVDAPSAEIGAEPFRRNAVVAGPGELTEFVQRFPGILGELQSLDALGFGFLDFFYFRDAHGHKCLTLRQKQKAHVTSNSGDVGFGTLDAITVRSQTLPCQRCSRGDTQR